jgi:hypothetical protein
MKIMGFFRLQLKHEGKSAANIIAIESEKKMLKLNKKDIKINKRSLRKKKIVLWSKLTTIGKIN